jgi:hypothetical protein
MRHKHTGAVKDVVADRGDRGPGAWSDSIGNAFLAPYELNNDKSTFTANGTAGPIHTNLGKIGDNLKVYAWAGASDATMEGGAPRCVCVLGWADGAQGEHEGSVAAWQRRG